MALYGTFATVRAQAPQTPRFATAFAYVAEALQPDSVAAKRIREIATGKSQRIELGDGVFVMEQAYETKARTDGVFEAHRAHIDVQVIIEGEEIMELADLSRMTVKQAYDAEKDYALYADTPNASQLRAFAGDVAIFFPVDVHMPTLRLTSAPVLVRKAVVKVPVG